MLALMAVVEWFVARNPLDFCDPVSLCWRIAAKDAQTRAPGSRILCAGDSLVKHAVIPKVVEQGTGQRAYNLAVARGPAPATYFLVRRALEAGTRPAAIVLDFKPGVLVASPRYNLRYWQETLSVRDALDLAWTARSKTIFFETLLGQFLPSFRSRLEVRGALLAALRGEDSPMRLINRTCERNWKVNDGANVASRNPAFDGAVKPKTLHSHIWYCHRVNTVYVRRILELASARGIIVYWLLPPVAPGLQAQREASGAEAGFLKFVHSMASRYPCVRVVDGRHSGYEHSVFVDPTHLDGLGARVLSQDLAALLAKDLAHPPAARPWRELTPFREPTRTIACEDVEQSKRIVSARR